ncbi:SUMF1/EgtB/PvdO family nonheme iron enzyme [Hafnia sp. HMSC23F03]|uniref:SUMF1/EgtB/PvdO family nonheme iron enzyme n=1 Tax=Hafnia sp. HMSC23F03 TaxID=1581059 RepID=UPI0011131B10
MHDIYGNTLEWVSDYYSTCYYAQSPEHNPQGPDGGTERVVRSGSWHSAWRKPSPRRLPWDKHWIQSRLHRLTKIIKKGGRICRLFHHDWSDATSITKRYLTSLFSIRCQAVLIS